MYNTEIFRLPSSIKPESLVSKRTYIYEKTQDKYEFPHKIRNVAWGQTPKDRECMRV